MDRIKLCPALLPLQAPEGTLLHADADRGKVRVRDGAPPRAPEPTCSQMAPVMVTGKGLTLPRPRFSRFLWLLKSFSSLFSSSSSELQ